MGNRVWWSWELERIVGSSRTEQGRAMTPCFVFVVGYTFFRDPPRHSCPIPSIQSVLLPNWQRVVPTHHWLNTTHPSLLGGGHKEVVRMLLERKDVNPMLGTMLAKHRSY